MRRHSSDSEVRMRTHFEILTNPVGSPKERLWGNEFASVRVVDCSQPISIASSWLTWANELNRLKVPSEYRCMRARSRTRRLFYAPWLVLVAMLGLTALGVLAQATAVANDRENARAAAAEHFDDVVSDIIFRGESVSASYNRVLLTSVALVESPVDVSEVAARLAYLTSDPLPGLQGFIVAPIGSDPQWTTAIPPVDLGFETNPASNISGRWVATIDGNPELIAVGVRTDAGDVVAAIATREELLGLHVHDHGGHGLSVTLTPPTNRSANPLGITAATSAQASTTELHDDDHSISDPVLQRVEQLDLFGGSWEVDTRADDEFLALPTNTEVFIVGVLGVLLSLTLFGLVFSLVRRLAADARGRAAEARFAAGFESSPIGFAILDSEGTIIEMNSALQKILNCTPVCFAGAPMSDVVAESMRDSWRARVLRPGPIARPRSEVHYVRTDGETVWVDETVTVVDDANGDRRILVQMTDVSEQRESREELQRRALHDELTGLANRTLLEDRLQQALRRTDRSRTMAAIMFADIDQFKSVNDTLGHTAGDELLVQLAERLRTLTRDHDTVARFGGDEFVMLCEDLQSQTDMWTIVDRIQEAMAKEFFVGERTIKVSLSIGITIFGADDTADDLMRDADLAMYQAKELGRDRAVLFEREMREDLLEQLRLEEDLVHAIERNELELYYQPILTVDQVDIAGFEALCRWNHPERGLMAPDLFLPMAAQLGLLRDIDIWALNEATTQLAEWTRELPFAANWAVAVNASPGNFADTTFPTIVEDAVILAGIDPGRLTIEITEEAILDNTETAISIIRRLRDIGIHTALDDFGTGYSSLSQLAALDIDVLKIDKSFLRDLEDPRSQEIVRAIVEMSRALGIPTVAEGVENHSDLLLLRAMGVNSAQGYLFSRPVPHGEVDDLATGLADTYAPRLAS